MQDIGNRNRNRIPHLKMHANRWQQPRVTIILDKQTLPLLSSSVMCIVLSESELFAVKTLSSHHQFIGSFHVNSAKKRQCWTAPSPILMRFGASIDL